MIRTVLMILILVMMAATTMMMVIEILLTILSRQMRPMDPLPSLSFDITTSGFNALISRSERGQNPFGLELYATATGTIWYQWRGYQFYIIMMAQYHNITTLHTD